LGDRDDVPDKPAPARFPPISFLQEVITGGDRMKGKRRKSSGEIYPIVDVVPTELPPPIEDKPVSEIFPDDPFGRCHLRWDRLFFGIWWAIQRYNPVLTFGLLQVLKRFGLANDNVFFPELIEPNPSDEILRRVTNFYNLPRIPNLKGKKLPEKRYDSFIALHDYSIALFELGDFRRKFRNPVSRMLLLRERLPKILPKMLLKRKQNFPEYLLKKWASLPFKEMAVRFVAYAHGLRSDSLQKYLHKARHEYPIQANSWRNGLATTKAS
jgi:hypothetical protein